MTAAAARLLLLLSTITVMGMLVACSRDEIGQAQEYVEGEFVSIAAPFASALETLAVQRGVQVKAARDEADQRVAQARAILRT